MSQDFTDPKKIWTDSLDFYKKQVEYDQQQIQFWKSEKKQDQEKVKKALKMLEGLK